MGWQSCHGPRHAPSRPASRQGHLPAAMQVPRLAATQRSLHPRVASARCPSTARARWRDGAWVIATSDVVSGGTSPTGALRARSAQRAHHARYRTRRARGASGPVAEAQRPPAPLAPERAFAVRKAARAAPRGHAPSRVTGRLALRGTGGPLRQGAEPPPTAGDVRRSSSTTSS